MCTLMIALGAAPGIDLAVSANRNEFLARPASPIAPWPAQSGLPRFAAPRDLKAGGTWQGVNERGLFVCITNRHGAQLDAKRRSRGELVLQALRCADLREARQLFAAVDGAAYNGFHLLVSNRHEALLLIGDGARAEPLSLGAGIHLITERSFGAGEGAREANVGREFTALFSVGAPTIEALRVPLTRHCDPQAPLEAACVHADAFGYGTRSSLQLLVPARGEARALFSEGHPCVTLPSDVSGMIAPLFGHG